MKDITITAGAVAKVGRRVIVVGVKIPAVDVVDIAVAVIVDSIPVDLARIRPYIGGEIGVLAVYNESLGRSLM